jgi:hypothetical protein
MLLKVPTFGLLAAIAAVAAIALVGAGGSTAGTATSCSSPDPQGRLVCVTVEDTDGVSPSGLIGIRPRQSNVTAYQYYKLTVANQGGSTLTNGSVTVDLTDVTPDGSAVSTAAYQASNSHASCSLVSTSPNRVKCTLANIPADSSAPQILLAYRTSTTSGVTATVASITTAFKEGTNPNGANPSKYTFAETTNLEPDPEASVSWSPTGQTTSLGTSPTFDSQFSTVAFKVPLGHSAFQSLLSEAAGTLCSDLVKQCFGEVVTMHLPADTGTFSSTNPFHLTITLVPADFGVTVGNTSSVAVVHQLDSGQIETITNRCSATPPAASDALPCIVVTKINQGQTKLLVIDLYGVDNGGIHPGLG